MISNNEKIKYFLYARKSSESEDRQMASIEDQINEVQKIADNLHIEVVAIFSESKSAKAPGRTVFNDMLLQIEQGKANGILCWKLNRLARNPLDGGKISWLLQQGVIQHIQCHGSDYKPSDNVLMMQVELGMANQYIKDLSTDVKRGVRAKAARGWYPSPRLPTGYIHNMKSGDFRLEEKEIIPDPLRFNQVRKLWDMMLKGCYSVAQVKAEADRMGLVSFKKRPYSYSNIHSLLRNEFYAGIFYWKDENGQVLRYQGKHKPMVTQREFNEVQKLLGNLKRSTRPKKYHFPYKGILTCGECGCSITSERKIQVRCTACRYKFSCKHRSNCPKCSTYIKDMKNATRIDITYYRCTKRKKKCSQGYLTQSGLEEQLEEMIMGMHIPQDFYHFMCEELKVLDAKNLDTSKKETTSLQKRVTELKKRITSLSLMRADGEIDKDEFFRVKVETQKQIDSLKKEIHTLSKSHYDWSKVAKEHLYFLHKGKNIFKNGNEKAVTELISKIGSNQRLLDKKLYITTLKPLLAIQDCFGYYINPTTIKRK